MCSTSLAAAQRVVNKSVLQPQLAAEIQAGNVTVTNQHAMLRDGYEYFRNEAKGAYAGDGRLPPDNFLVDLIAGAGSQEGWWNTLRPMVQAYFSLLEHVLIGCLPFTSFDPATEDLVWVIGAKWNEKMKTVVDPTDSESKRQFDALHDIRGALPQHLQSWCVPVPKVRPRCSSQVPDVGGVPVTLGAVRSPPGAILRPARCQGRLRPDPAVSSTL